MFEIPLKMCLGVLLGGVSVYGLVANLLVFLPVYRLAFVFKKSPIYVISLVNLFADILNLLVTAAYLTPLILKNSFSNHSTTDMQLSFVFGTVFMFCWYLGSITQIIMAVNRLVVICFRYKDFFTVRMLTIIFCFVFPMVICMTYLAQFRFPCCALIYDSNILSISYLSTGNELNYSNAFIDVPLNFGCSMTAAICYFMIILKIYKAKKLVGPISAPNQGKNKEVSYAIQFCLISVFYTISWVLFRLFPIILGTERLELYCFVMIAVSLNNSANAFVYIIFNKEVLGYILRSRFFIFPHAGISTYMNSNANATVKLASTANIASTIRQN